MTYMLDYIILQYIKNKTKKYREKMCFLTRSPSSKQVNSTDTKAEHKEPVNDAKKGAKCGILA